MDSATPPRKASIRSEAAQCPQGAEELRAFAAEKLGPACVQALHQQSHLAQALECMHTGTAIEDAVLGLAHRLAQKDGAIADEFIGYFLSQLLRLGSGSFGPRLRRFLDTGDLVQSVLGDLWPGICEIEFRTRAQFMSLLAQRMRWKMANKGRALRGPNRREDRKVPTSPEQLRISDEGHSPPSLAAMQEDRERLILTLLRLPERDRRLLTLFLQGKPLAEIADKIQLEEWATRKALERAIDRARKLN